jgi:glycine/D-amino acid oxidase-like deaminating enzyme
MKEVDFLVIGQGIAGTVFSFKALQQGFRVHVVDRVPDTSASKVAGGLINPITGRFFKKSWRFDELLPSIESTYREMEALLNIQCWHLMPIYRMLSSIQELNDWELCRAKPGYEAYMGSCFRLEDDRLQAHEGLAPVNNGSWLETAQLIDSYRAFLLDTGRFSADNFDIADLQASSWKGVSFKHIVFCQGIASSEHPFFRGLSLRAAKGEVMVIEMDGPDLDFVLNKNMLFIPLGNGQYKVGATFEHTEDTSLTESGLAELSMKLESVIRSPYRIVRRQAGIRPTVKDRRPLLGRSDVFPDAYVFNGLGTKGVSLAPYFAEHLLNFIIRNKPLLPEVDWKRLA